jgi:FkbM family methyltransferase
MSTNNGSGFLDRVRSRVLPRGTIMLGKELRARLINIELKQDDVAAESRTRLINAEARLELMAAESRTRLLNAETRLERIERMGGVRSRDTSSFRFEGSPDQGFGHITYAQFGEDLMVANIFALLGIHRPSYIDLGANDPIAGSNTALLYARGSRGVAVDANPNYVDIWKQVRPDDIFLNVGVASERGSRPFKFFGDWSGRNTFNDDYAAALTEIDVKYQVQDVRTIELVTVNDIIEQTMEGRWPDFLSLDVEGLDYAVLAGANFDQNRPLVLCIETRDGAGNDTSTPFLALLREKGYVPIFRTWGNLIAVHHTAMATLNL